MIPDQSTETVKLLILGTGTYAMEVADLVSDIPHIELAGFVASMPPFESGSTMMGKPIYWIDAAQNLGDG